MHDINSNSSKVGYPNIFLIMKCNTQPPENKNALFSWQRVIDCPDIAADIFRIKLSALMAFTIHEQVFANVNAHVRVLAFSKTETFARLLHILHDTNIKNHSIFIQKLSI